MAPALVRAVLGVAGSAPAVAQGDALKLKPHLTPTIKPQPPPPIVTTKPAEVQAAPHAKGCACSAMVDVPIYRNGAVVGYKRISRPTGKSAAACCR